MNKYRFRQLLESQIGNVKPLLSEALEANAGAIQQFLKDNQDKTIVVDYNFGPKSAAATGKYIARGWNANKYNDVTTVYKLWELMKEDGWDVGTTPGFGPMMAKEVANILDQSKTKLDAWYASQNKSKTDQTQTKTSNTTSAYVQHALNRPYDIGKI
jgi:hypothetical protein